MSSLSTKLGNMFRIGNLKRGPVEVDANAASSNAASSNPDPSTSSAMTPSRRDSREAMLQQLRDGYMEVVDTMKAMRSHMDEQSRRADRMMQLMEGLPEVLQSIPQTNQRQTEVLQAMRSQMETQTKTTGQLSTALGDLAGATERQQSVMRDLQSQLDASRASGDALRESLGTLSQTMESVAGASKSNVDAVNRIAEQTRDNHRTTGELFRRTQKQATVMSAVSWALALAALSVAGYVAVMVTNVADRPIASQAPAATPDTIAAAEAIGDPTGESADALDAATPAQAAVLPPAPATVDAPATADPPAPTISDNADATSAEPLAPQPAGAEAGWLAGRFEDLPWLPKLNLEAITPGLPADEGAADAEAPAPAPADAEPAQPAAEQAIADPAPSTALDGPTDAAKPAADADAASEEPASADPAPTAEPTAQPTPVEAAGAE